MTLQDELKRANSIAQSAIGTYTTSIVSTSASVTSAKQMREESSSDAEHEVKILTDNNEEIGS